MNSTLGSVVPLAMFVVSINVEKHKQFVERLMLGKFNSTWGDLKTRQFKGSVSNIQVCTFPLNSTTFYVFFPKVYEGKRNLEDLTSRPCDTQGEVGLHSI